MHVACSLGILAHYERRQRLDQRNSGIAGIGRRECQRGDVVQLGLALGRDDRSRGRRNDANGRFRARQCCLEVEHPLNPASI